jgi:hypothetical protein
MIKQIREVMLKNVNVDISAISNDGIRLDGMKFNFLAIHEDKIYHKSNGDVVGVLPQNLEISLNTNELIQFNALLLETISSYLYNIRKKIFVNKDLIEVISTKIDKTYYIKVRVSKFFFREEERGRYKISVAFINKETNKEIVNLNFSKRDVTVLSSFIKEITTSYDRIGTYSFDVNILNKETSEIISSKRSAIMKVNNSLLIDEIWLHGQELLNTMYTLDQLVYKLNIEDDLNKLNSFYRQIKFYSKNDILHIRLFKMNSEHGQEPIMLDGVEIDVEVPISSRILSILFLTLNINVLKHSELEEELNSEILGSDRINLGKNIKYHISMKESSLGIAIRPRTKTPNISRFSFVGEVKDGAFLEENEFHDMLPNYIKKYDQDGNFDLVPVLTKFNIDMKDQWFKLIYALGIAYTKEYITEERDFNIVKFFVINQNNEGRFKYEFSIFSDSKNKAPAVLQINKFKTNKGAEDEFVSRYRQPLFERYVYQLLMVLMASASEIDNIELLREESSKTLLPYQYKSFKKVNTLKKDKIILYGIKKTKDEVLFGNFSVEGLSAKLSFEDLLLIRLSVFFRITKGYWIPVTGEKFSIGQDGYFTEMYGELNMEEEKCYWPSKLYVGTSI